MYELRCFQKRIAGCNCHLQLIFRITLITESSKLTAGTGKLLFLIFIKFHSFCPCFLSLLPLTSFFLGSWLQQFKGTRKLKSFFARKPSFWTFWLVDFLMRRIVKTFLKIFGEIFFEIWILKFKYFRRRRRIRRSWRGGWKRQITWHRGRRIHGRSKTWRKFGWRRRLTEVKIITRGKTISLERSF